MLVLPHWEVQTWVRVSWKRVVQVCSRIALLLAPLSDNCKFLHVPEVKPGKHNTTFEMHYY